MVRCPPPPAARLGLVLLLLVAATPTHGAYRKCEDPCPAGQQCYRRPVLTGSCFWTMRPVCVDVKEMANATAAGMKPMKMTKKTGAALTMSPDASSLPGLLPAGHPFSQFAPFSHLLQPLPTQPAQQQAAPQAAPQPAPQPAQPLPALPQFNFSHLSQPQPGQPQQQLPQGLPPFLPNFPQFNFQHLPPFPPPQPQPEQQAEKPEQQAAQPEQETFHLFQLSSRLIKPAQQVVESEPEKKMSPDAELIPQFLLSAPKLVAPQPAEEEKPAPELTQPEKEKKEPSSDGDKKETDSSLPLFPPPFLPHLLPFLPPLPPLPQAFPPLLQGLPPLPQFPQPAPQPQPQPQPAPQPEQKPAEQPAPLPFNPFHTPSFAELFGLAAEPPTEAPTPAVELLHPVTEASTTTTWRPRLVLDPGTELLLPTARPPTTTPGTTPAPPPPTDPPPTSEPPPSCAGMECGPGTACLLQDAEHCPDPPCYPEPICEEDLCERVSCGEGKSCVHRVKPDSTPGCDNFPFCRYKTHCPPTAQPKFGYCPSPEAVTDATQGGWKCQFDNQCESDLLCCPSSNKGVSSCVQPAHEGRCADPAAACPGATCAVINGTTTCLDSPECYPGAYICQFGLQTFCTDAAEWKITGLKCPPVHVDPPSHMYATAHSNYGYTTYPTTTTGSTNYNYNNNYNTNTNTNSNYNNNNYNGYYNNNYNNGYYNNNNNYYSGYNNGYYNNYNNNNNYNNYKNYNYNNYKSYGNYGNGYGKYGSYSSYNTKSYGK